MANPPPRPPVVENNEHIGLMRQQQFDVAIETTNLGPNATINDFDDIEEPTPVESTKIKTDSYNVGQFCPHCGFSDDILCNKRVEYMVQKYKTSEEEAMKSEDILTRCKTPRIGHKVYAKEDEPSVILHAGPHKTGTTALQAFIYDLIYVNATIFPRDNLRIPSYDELPGVFAKEGVGLNLPHCSIDGFKNNGGGMNAGMCARMRLAFPRFVQDAYNKSENVLIVAEDFDRVEIDFNRLRFYLQPYKKVKVVVTYRRLHDWLPSWYNQIMDHYTIVYAKGEEKFPNFVEWIDTNYDKFLQAHGIKLADRYRSYDFVESVHLINMHEVGKNMIDHFFCNHLQAKATCQAIKEGAKPSKSNIGSDHEYERLTIKAKLSGKIPTDLGKPVNLIRASKYLKQRVEEINATLPIICPREALLKQVFQTELEQERTYFPEWHESQGGEEGLRNEFDMAVKKKFCSFDVDKIIDSGMLDSIFKEFTF